MSTPTDTNVPYECEIIDDDLLPASTTPVPGTTLATATPGDLVETPPAIPSEELVRTYGKIIDQIDQDRAEVDGFVQNVADMVFNEGDATTSSKELFVQLLKLKADASDKKIKIADLMTRVNLRERDTFPKYLNASQTNVYYPEEKQVSAAEKREIIAKARKGSPKKG